MADLDVQVQLSLRDDLSRPARKAMDAVRAASRTAEGGMGGVAKQAAGDAGAGLVAAGAVGRAALTAPVNREQQYLYDATVAFNDRSAEGIRAGVAELRALDQQIVARGGGTLDSARAMRGAFMAGGVDFADVARLAPLTQRAATAAGAEGADFANTLMAGPKSGQFAYGDAEKVFGMMLTAGASGSFETRDMAQYLPGIFNATGDMRGMTGTAYHLAGLETIRDATGDSAEAANRYQNLLSFRNSKEAYSNLSKKGINLAHVYRDAAKRGEDMNLAFVGAIQGLVERNKEYKRLKKELPGATGARADEIRNQMGAIQNRIFSEIIGDMQARQGAIALQNGRGRYGEIYGDLTRAPEAMIDKLFSVMTSATQENLNRLANEWEKGMDRVLDVVKGPLQDAIQWASGLMADNPELTAAAAGAVTVGGMAAAGSSVAAGLRGLRSKAAGAQAATGSQATASGTGRGGQATGQGGRPGSSATHKANAALVVLSAAGQAYATENDDSLTREQKNAAHAETAGGAVGALAGAQAGAAVGATAGPVGAAVGSVAGGVIGGLAGTELGKEVYAYHQKVQRSLDALPYDPDDPDAYLTALSARAEATGRGPEQRPDAFDDYGAALFGGTTSFLDTGEGLEERLATLASRDDDRRTQEELKAALLEAARNMQTVQEQPLKVELHSTLELDGAVLAQSREDIMIREAARR